MPLDPQIRQLLTMLNAMGTQGLSSTTPQQARRWFRTFTVDLRPPETIVPVAAAEDVELPGPAGSLPARRYRPEAAGPMPTIVFFHGGGFVIGDIDTHDNQCRTLCRDVGAVVLSVGYRLAPETPWPGAVEDCLAATRWAGEHVGELGGDPAAIAVAGDSAGGNLAAVVAQRVRDEGGPRLAAQLLIYPGVDMEEDEARYPSYAANGEGFFLTADDMRWFADQYAGPAADRRDPTLSPLHGTLAGLPPAVITTAEYDPLRDQGTTYADALRGAGVPVVHLDFPGLIHGYFDMSRLSPACAEAVGATCEALRERLAAA
ncbi:MAG TPA: alpha/beta hydrolase [Solirubrobacteraceae bacterium]|nr:alpha/beta hydrolase [Solirubrobacteraceae bacterium]